MAPARRARAPGSREPSRLGRLGPGGLRSLAHRSETPAPRGIKAGRDGLLSESLRQIGVQTLSFSTRPCRGDPHGFVAVIRYRVRHRRRAWRASVVVPIMRPAPVGRSPIVVAFAVSFRLSRRRLHCRVSPPPTLRCRLEGPCYGASRTLSKRARKAPAKRVTGVRSRTVEAEMKACGCFGQGLLAC